MREIIERWCGTNNLSLEDAMTLLTEYFSLTNRTVTSEQLQMMLQMSQAFWPIDWDMMITQICLSKGWTLATVTSKPDQNGNVYRVCRYVY